MNHLAKALLERYEAGEILRASKLNRLVDSLNAQGRSIPRANDAGDWFECLSSVDAPEYSVLGITNCTADYHALLAEVGDVDGTTEVFVANENYPLVAGKKGWVKIINPARPCLVRCLGNPVFLDDLNVLSQAVLTAGSGTGSGSGSGSSGVQSPLWALTSPNPDGQCWVLGSRLVGTQVALFALADSVTSAVIGGESDPASNYADCYMLTDGLRRDTGTTYSVFFYYMEGVLIPYSQYNILTNATVCAAIKIGERWFAISGGLRGLSGTRSNGGFATVFGPDVPASVWCNQIVPNGADIISVLIDGSPMIIGDCCYNGTGT